MAAFAGDDAVLGQEESEEGSLGPLLEIMKDLDAHYNAQDDIVNLGKIFGMESDVDNIIKEKEMGPRELIRGTYNLRHVFDFTSRTRKLTLYSRSTELTEKVENAKEEAARNDESKKHRERRVLIEKDIEEITANIQSQAQEEREAFGALEKLEKQLADVNKKHAKLNHQSAVDAPRVKYALSLYGNISNIVWDYTVDNVKGVITSPYGGPVTPFNIDPRSCSSFEITNRLWGLMESTA